MTHPLIIQGGMGVAVSGWPLANAVSRLGQLGVVSGTIMAVVLARRLQQGDQGGHARWALERFPIRAMASRILDRYFVRDGKADDTAFASTPMPTISGNTELTELTVVANFAEVALAKKGHDGVVGINLLEKVSIPTMASLFGAMLAGVDYVLMGAGIPRAIPGLLDLLSEWKKAFLDVPVAQASANEPASTNEEARFERMEFDPVAFMEGEATPTLKRPHFFAIVSSATLATTLARKASGKVDGFVIEGEIAGGHNAPPRVNVPLSDAGEPVYGVRDALDIDKIKALGLPFWMAGAYARHGHLSEAVKMGAAGIQVGTPFAFCEESGMTTELKKQACLLSCSGKATVFTDPSASPTGFPFKVLQMEGTLSDPEIYSKRKRICDLGYLREPFRRLDGQIGYRCPAEPEAAYVRKGGDAADTLGCKCLCNALLADVGLGQVQRKDKENIYKEPPLITAGREMLDLARYMTPGESRYKAEDVIQVLLKEFNSAESDKEI